MNKKMATIPLIIFAMVLTMFAQVFATYTVNSNPQLSFGTSWQAQSWNSDAGDYTQAYSTYVRAYRSDGLSPHQWGNREFAQCRDPWGGPYGSSWGDNGDGPYLTASGQSISVRAKYVSCGVYHNGGGGAQYINLWIKFQSTVGISNLQYAEVIIYLKTTGLVQTWSSIKNDGAGTYWYFKPIYLWSQIGTSWTTKSIDYNDIINQLCNDFSITSQEKATGRTIGMMVGAEAYMAHMKGDFDYCYYYSN